MTGRSLSLFVVGLVGVARVMASVALSTSTVSCSSNSSAGDAGGGTSSDQACTDSAHATCSEMQSCTPANIQTTYGDEPTCEVRIKAACLDSLAAPSTGARSSKTEACAQAYATYSCTDYRNKANVPAACQQPTGSIVNGAACEFPGQCQSGFCAIAPGAACGKCAEAPKEGDACAQLTSCGQALTCTADTFTCTSFATQGQSCGIGQPCGAGLSCVAPGGAGAPGTCQLAGARAGAACDGSLKVASGCDGALGLYCDGVTKQCAQTTYAGAQQPCGYASSVGTLVSCTAGSCEGADSSKGKLGQCVARAADDGACSVPDGGASAPSAGCLPSARCVASNGSDGTCQVVTASNCR